MRAWSLAILGALRTGPGHRAMAAASGREALPPTCTLVPIPANRRRPAREVLTRLIQGEQDGERLTELRAAAERHFHPECRARDDDQPRRQRALCPAGMARRESAAARRSGSDPHRRGGIPALREPVQLGNRLVAGNPGWRRGDPGGRDHRHRHRGSQPRPGGVFDPDRLDIPGAPATGIWPSPRGRISAIGLNVARMEGRIAIGRFLARFPSYRLSQSGHPGRASAVPRVPVDTGGRGVRRDRAAGNGRLPRRPRLLLPPRRRRWGIRHRGPSRTSGAGCSRARGWWRPGRREVRG